MPTIEIKDQELYNNLLAISKELKEDNWIMSPYLYRIATPKLREDSNGSRTFLEDWDWFSVEIIDDEEKICKEIKSYFNDMENFPENYNDIKNDVDALINELKENYWFYEISYENDVKYEFYFLTRKKAEDFLETYKHHYQDSYVFQESFKNDDLKNIFNFLKDILW